MPRPAFDVASIFSLGMSVSRIVALVKSAVEDDELSSREVLKLATNLGVILRDFGVDLPDAVDDAIESNEPDALLQSLIDLLSNLKVKIRK